jgi:pimeloyl-ACP methyl ester carboxylesterase
LSSPGTKLFDALLPQVEIQIVPNAGHAPFRDEAAAFNRRLSAFADEIRGTKGRSDVRAS